MGFYAEHVMEHYKRPHGRGTLPDATHRYDDGNPSCGDRIAVALRVEDGVIVAARQEASGCAISQAGASMLFERLEGMRVTDVLALGKEDILAEFGDTLAAPRVKCALLALAATRKALGTGDDRERAGTGTGPS
jgi:nitrogen fixation NifU-like protein